MIPSALSEVAPYLRAVPFDGLPGFEIDGLRAVWDCFLSSCHALCAGTAPLRPAIATPDAWTEFFRSAATGPRPADDREAARFFRERFDAFQIGREGDSFFTGYYEPETDGALERSSEFSEPILARPRDLETFAPGHFPLGAPFSAGRRGVDGVLTRYPTRRQIESDGVAAAQPMVWVADGVEAFKIHVQGSARIRVRDGSFVRLTYAGRNGRSYSSIGKLLVAEGEIPASDISPQTIYRWIRSRGQAAGEPGRALMQRNESYIFFELNRSLAEDFGPLGAASVSLSPLRSIALDRNFWPYGLPYWIVGDWRSGGAPRFSRMLIGQDTGSAILGAARADIFFGSGEAAGRAAGEIRHPGTMFVLLPRILATE